jgi:hypothetical protein
VVVPRVIVAHPPKAAVSARADTGKQNLIIYPPGYTAQPKRRAISYVLTSLSLGINPE